MVRVVLISCGKRKLPGKSKASDLYIGAYFKYQLRYARNLEPDRIYILSAKYGLIGLDDEIDTYNCTLNQKSTEQREEWASKVLRKLSSVSDLSKDEFTILAGLKYREFIEPAITHLITPLAHLSRGRQLQFMRRALHEH